MTVAASIAVGAMTQDEIATRSSCMRGLRTSEKENWCYALRYLGCSSGLAFHAPSNSLTSTSSSEPIPLSDSSSGRSSIKLVSESELLLAAKRFAGCLNRHQYPSLHCPPRKKRQGFVRSVACGVLRGSNSSGEARTCAKSHSDAESPQVFVW